jgi:hypothetical protein
MLRSRSAPEGLFMTTEQMQRSAYRLSALTLGVMLLVGVVKIVYPLQAQGAHTAANRTGDTAYTPTKLEWAALELQADYGNTNWTSETPVMITFLEGTDGTTMLCVLQYTPEVPAQVLKITRDSEQNVFDKYAEGRGWTWLRLQFQERILPRPSH